MPDPSQARIDAALRLAESLVEYDEKYHRVVDWDPVLKRGLEAYRATLPKPRTRAEVDAEIVALQRKHCRIIRERGAVYGTECPGGIERWERIQALCAEPIAPEPED